MSDNNKSQTSISDEESRLFREAVAKVPAQTLQSTRSSPEQSVEIDIPEPQDSEIILGKILPDEWVSSEDKVAFFRSGIPQRTRNKLKRGQIAVEAKLDLHRMTGNQALQETRRFLLNCLKNNKRCVLIIHGKGDSQRYQGPVLKNLVVQWLKTKDCVLAYTSAAPKQGSTGAVCVLINNQCAKK